VIDRRPYALHRGTGSPSGQSLGCLKDLEGVGGPSNANVEAG